MENASVVVAGGEAARDVRKLMAIWARQGITGPSLWIDPVDVTEAPPAPVSVTAELIDREGEHRVDLFAHLGRFRLDLVRVVVAQFAATAEAASPELTELGEKVGEAIQSVLPRNPSGEVRTDLHRSVVVIPASGVSGIPSGILAPRWEGNVIISPEDRPDLDRMSVYVRAAENYPGHAAAAVAAAAGIIRGVPGGVFDRVRTHSSSNPDDLVVARVSIRTVVGEGLVDVLAREALQPAALLPDGPARAVTWASSASEPDLITRRAVKAMLSSEEWAAQPPPAGASPAPTREAFFDALGRAARFNVRTVAAVGAWTANRGRSNLERSATDSIVGDSAGVMVTIGPRATDSAEEVARVAIDSARRHMDDEIAYEASRGNPPPASTWGVLRDLAFGLADGSATPGMEEPMQNGVREVLAPADIVPAPDAHVRTKAGEEIDALDLRELHAYQAQLAGAMEARQAELARLQREGSAPVPTPVPAPVTEPASADAEANADEKPGDEGESATTTASTADENAADAQIAAGEERVARARDAVQEARDDATELAAWYAENTRSVVSQVGENIVRRLDDLEASRRRYLDRRDDVTVPPAEVLDRAKRSLLRRWGWTLGLLAATLGCVWLWALTQDEAPVWPDYIWSTAVLATLAIVVLILFNHAFYKAFRRYEWDVANVLAQQRSAADLYLWEGKQLARTRMLFAGWRDWAAVISEVVHRPWEPVATPHEDLTDDVIARFPAAMAVGRQQEQQVELGTRLLVSAWRAIYKQGWAQQAFAEAYEPFAERALARKLQAHLEVDTDISGSDLGARRQLVKFWQSGAARAHLGGRRTARLQELSNAGEFDLPHRIVGRVGKYSDGTWQDEPTYFLPITTSETTFAHEVFASAARAANHHYVKSVQLWLPQVVHSAAPATGAGAPGVTLGQSDASTALRVDLSSRLQRKDVAVLKPDGEGRPVVDYSYPRPGTHSGERTEEREFL